MDFVASYALSLWNIWFWLAGAFLTLNEIGSKFFGVSWEWPVRNRAKAVVLILLLAQVGAYKALFDDTARKLAEAASKQQPAVSPVIAENPDHANLVANLEATRAQRDDWERRYNTKRSDKEKAVARTGELEGRVRALESDQEERARRQALVKQLGIFHAGSAQLIERVARVPDEELTVLRSKWGQGIIDALIAAGRESDARYFNSSSLPEGFPSRISTPPSIPSSHQQAYMWLLTRQFKLEQIMRQLDRD